MARLPWRSLEPGADGYPGSLVGLPDAPGVLYVIGNPFRAAPHVAVVGTRRASRYGLEAAAWLGQGLAEAGVVVVSGMATGIDGAAHRGALAASGATVAVLGCGVDICYPRAHAALYGQLAERGTLVSEYPPGTMPAPWRFPARNRIIAGLCQAVVIVEARVDGGAMITARLAMEYGREVLAVPGPVHALGSEGPHRLVRDGARLVGSPADVLEELGLSGRPALPPERRAGAADEPPASAKPARRHSSTGKPPGRSQLRGQGQLQEVGGRASPPSSEGPAPPAEANPTDRAVLGAVEADPALVERIAGRARVTLPVALGALSRLELAGWVSRYPGGRFALPVQGGPDATRGPR